MTRGGASVKRHLPPENKSRDSPGVKRPYLKLFGQLLPSKINSENLNVMKLTWNNNLENDYWQFKWPTDFSQLDDGTLFNTNSGLDRQPQIRSDNSFTFNLALPAHDAGQGGNSPYLITSRIGVNDPSLVTSQFGGMVGE